MMSLSKRALFFGTLLLGLAVLIGAFGAHGLKAMVTVEKLATFETGVRYHVYHALGLVLLGLFSKFYPEEKLGVVFMSFIAGIFIFSFNCYLYVLTDMKVFAMIVPVGGLLFVLGWLTWSWKIFRLRETKTTIGL
jgi:uncharacterized membrane protein YgdD (TMEM256/DUF423 family)